LRTAWAVIMAVLCLLAGSLVVLALLRARPISPGDWHLALVTIALLLALAAQSVNVWRHSRDRQRLARMIEAISARSTLDMLVASLVMHERLVAVRQNRVLVPALLYRVSRAYLRRATAKKASIFPVGDDIGTELK